jgi:hypothetical protein
MGMKGKSNFIVILRFANSLYIEAAIKAEAIIFSIYIYIYIYIYILS